MTESVAKARLSNESRTRRANQHDACRKPPGSAAMNDSLSAIPPRVCTGIIVAKYGEVEIGDGDAMCPYRELRIAIDQRHNLGEPSDPRDSISARLQMIGQSRAIFLVSVVMLSAGSAMVRAEEPLYETVKIVREATFKAPTLFSNSGKFRVEMDLKLQPDGTLGGTANYTYRWQHDHAAYPPSVWEGSEKFDVVGTQQGGTISVVAPKEFKITQHDVWQTGKSSHEIRHTPSGRSVYNQWNEFKLGLTNLHYSAKEHQEFQAVFPITADVTTEATATPAPSLRVAVSAKRPLIPGHLRYFNELTVTLSGTSAPADGASVLVSLAAGDLGRLSEDRGWAGTPTLKLTGVKAGQPRTFYYAWAAAPPTTIHRATVTATVEGVQQAKGSASFEVGVNFEVVRASQLVGQSISTGKRTLIGVRVRDSLHPDRDPGALAGELGIRPVLGMKQTGFIPLANLEQFVDGLSLNAAGLLEYAMGAAHGGTAIAIGNMIDWNVSESGLLIGHGTGEDGYPTIRFQDRGVFVFEFDVMALSYDEGRMPEPESPKHVARFATTQLDPNGAFLFETLVPCLQGLVGALKEDPLAQAQTLWECLHGALSSELAQDAIGHNVVANTIGGLIAQAIDAGFQIAGHEPTTAAEQVGEQTLEVIQATLKSTPGTYVTLVEKSGTTRFDTTSSTAGALQPGPAKLDLRAIRPTNDADRARAAEIYAPNRRIQEGKRFAVVAAGEKETLTLDLGGERGRGEIVVVSSHGVVRAAYPAGPWASQVEVRPDGTMRVVSGTALNIERRATKPANASPGVPTPAPIDLRRSQPARNERLGS